MKPGGYSEAGCAVINGAKEIQNEVDRHKQDIPLLHAELERWTELRKAGIPKRESAAADAAREAAQHAGNCEKEAREAKSRAFAERKVLEELQRDWTERRRIADAKAQRAEEQLEVARRNLNQWRAGADTASAEAKRRRVDVLDAARLRLSKIKADAEARHRTAAEDLEDERQRGDTEVAGERLKLERKLQIAESQGEEQRRRSRAQVQVAELTSATAERKADQHEAAAQKRSERSGEAAASKQRLATSAHKNVEEKSTMRIEQAQEEHELRVKAAEEKVAYSKKALQKRVDAAEAQIAAARRQRDVVHEDREEIERAYKKMVESVRVELSARTAFWEAMLQEGEVDAARRVADVRGVEERLQAELVDDVTGLKEQWNAEAAAVSARAIEHSICLDQQLARRQDLTANVLQHVEHRIAHAEALAQAQYVETEVMGQHAVEQATADLKRCEHVASDRMKQAVGQLMTYLERPSDVDVCMEGEAENLGGTGTRLLTAYPGGISLEMSIGLPGSPELPDSCGSRTSRALSK